MYLVIGSRFATLTVLIMSPWTVSSHSVSFCISPSYTILYEQNEESNLFRFLYLPKKNYIKLKRCVSQGIQVAFKNNEHLALFNTQGHLMMPIRKRFFERIVRKGENAGNQRFLLFSQCFLPYQKISAPLQPH